VDRSVIALRLGPETMQIYFEADLAPKKEAPLRPAPFNTRWDDIGPRSAAEIPQESVNDPACEEELVDARGPVLIILSAGHSRVWESVEKAPLPMTLTALSRSQCYADYSERRITGILPQCEQLIFYVLATVFSGDPAVNTDFLDAGDSFHSVHECIIKCSL
jgi:hypothetical protein